MKKFIAVGEQIHWFITADGFNDSEEHRGTLFRVDETHLDIKRDDSVMLELTIYTNKDVVPTQLIVEMLTERVENFAGKENFLVQLYND